MNITTANIPKAATRDSLIPSEQNGLTREQIASFEENGFLHVPGVIAPEEVAILQNDAAKITEEDSVWFHRLTAQMLYLAKRTLKKKITLLVL